MEIGEDPSALRHDSPEAVPSLIEYISDNAVADFDIILGSDGCSNQYQPSSSGVLSAPVKESEEVADHVWKPADQPTNHQRTQSISISMPPSPTGHHSQDPERVIFCDNDPNLLTNKVPEVEAKFFSQPMPKGALYLQSAKCDGFSNHPKDVLPNHPQPQAARDPRFDTFKTWSGKLERQLTILRGKPVEPEPEPKRSHHLESDALPVDRYFDALEGPELDTLRPMEEAVLPADKSWPFLLRFTVPSFGICLGMSGQAILWKTLATSSSTKFLHISLKVNLILWFISTALTAIVFSIYFLKLIFYLEAVRREYYHPVRVNFFFAPWIVLLFLCLGVPPSVAQTLPHALWYILMAPILCLELKIYGQWMSGGQRRLSKVANPCNHIAVVGNFVGALLGASMGLREGPLFFFAVGLAHYIVLFVTLYQRLPTNKTLPKELHPVFFLFVAAPSVASMAWAKIQGSFNYGSRIIYFIALFLYFSLAVRVNFFRGFRFSVAWWAYTFPMTGAAVATIKYSNEVTNWFTRSLTVTLCIISTLVVTSLLATTIIHAFVLRDLFPNDNAIAISDRPPMARRKWFHPRAGSSDINDIENYLKFVSSDGKETEGRGRGDAKNIGRASSKPQNSNLGESEC